MQWNDGNDWDWEGGGWNNKWRPTGSGTTPMPEGQGSRLLPKKGTGWQPGGQCCFGWQSQEGSTPAEQAARTAAQAAEAAAAASHSWVGGSWAIQEKAPGKGTSLPKGAAKEKGNLLTKGAAKEKGNSLPKGAAKEKGNPCPKEEPKKKETPCHKEQAKKKETPCQKEQEKKGAPGQKGQKESVPPEGSKMGSQRNLALQRRNRQRKMSRAKA